MDREQWRAYEASWCDGTGRPTVLPRHERPPLQVGDAALTVQPVIPHGCPKCCGMCNLAVHTCPGCGRGLEHGVGVCLRCRNDLRTYL